MHFCEHVFLVGMAGCGKTTLGRKAAQNLGIDFFDTDQYISQAMKGMTVNEIYSQLGEDFFRLAETAALVELTGKPPCIISTGEGTVLSDENVRIMRSNGTVIFVDRPLDQILSDLKTDRRPTLHDSNTEEIIRQYKMRVGHYRSAADFTFDNSRGYYMGVGRLTSLIETLYTR